MTRSVPTEPLHDIHVYIHGWPSLIGYEEAYTAALTFAVMLGALLGIWLHTAIPRWLG
jgi:hypothetical protein